MAATNSTTNYGLPQWLATDKPERTDFNTAMADIDTNINLVQGNLANIMSSLMSGKSLDSNVDLNNLYGTSNTGHYGIYSSFTYTNCPIDSGMLVVFGMANNITYQIAMGLYDIYYRGRTTSTWYSWRKITNTAA